MLLFRGDDLENGGNEQGITAMTYLIFINRKSSHCYLL